MVMEESTAELRGELSGGTIEGLAYGLPIVLVTWSLLILSIAVLSAMLLWMGCMLRLSIDQDVKLAAFIELPRG